MFGDELMTSLVTELQHNGHTITADSWLYLKLDSRDEPMLVSLDPLSGMFTVDGNYFLHVMVYHGVALSNPTPLRTACIPGSLEPVSEILSLDEIAEIAVLWPSDCEGLEQGETQWTFSSV